MKRISTLTIVCLISCLCLQANAKPDIKTLKVKDTPEWWNTAVLNTFRLPPPPAGATLEYEDLNGDGHFDVLRTILPDGTPVQWIDDDGDLQAGDAWGDIDSDCIMIDRNRDGFYGGEQDLIIDYMDTDGDGMADMQVIVDYPFVVDGQKKNGGGHYMWVIDTDHDNVFNYIDWHTYTLQCWEHTGLADCYTDYHGNSTFLKIHSTPEKMKDPSLNWENPFLFYDPDGDGLTEFTVRMCDDGREKNGRMNWMSMAYDVDNDNSAENPLDMDMTIRYQGDENYMTEEYTHTFEAMRGLPESDRFFMDPSWRQNTRLIFPDITQAMSFFRKTKDWKYIWFTFDEDDDCKRWERVELYQPQKDLYAVGEKAKGLDNHRQSDAAGDRGEWDTDASGAGKLYAAPFDGRIHLYGAEWGAWRVDQRAEYYQGMYNNTENAAKMKKGNVTMPVVKYEDTDGNGFFDRISFDWNADKEFEETVSLKELGIDDTCPLFDHLNAEYADIRSYFNEVADKMWYNAQAACKVAGKYGVDPLWYSFWLKPKSTFQKYDFGFWVQVYLYHDIMDAAIRSEGQKAAEKVRKAYFSGTWETLLSEK